MRDRRPVLPARLDTKGVVEAYRRIAPVYDLWGRMTESRAHRLCLGWLDLQAARRVLDVATGTGALVRGAAAEAPGARFIGADLSRSMITRARASLDRLRVSFQPVLADARRLPFRSSTIDVILNGYMFDLLPEEQFAEVLAEFSRVLVPGGQLGLINMAVSEKIRERFWETIYRIRPSLLGGCRGVRMTAHLAEAGFSVGRTGRVTQLGFPSEIIVARNRGGQPHLMADTGL